MTTRLLLEIARSSAMFGSRVRQPKRSTRYPTSGSSIFAPRSRGSRASCRSGSPSRRGSPPEDAKKISKLIRDEGPKGRQGHRSRATSCASPSKKRDDLQAVQGARPSPGLRVRRAVHQPPLSASRRCFTHRHGMVGETAPARHQPTAVAVPALEDGIVRAPAAAVTQTRAPVSRPSWRACVRERAIR